MKKTMTVSLLLAVTLVLTVVIILLTGGTDNLMSSGTYASLAGYFEGDLSGEEAYVIVDGTQAMTESEEKTLPVKGWEVNGQWYLSCEDAQRLVGSRMYADREEGIAVYALPEVLEYYKPNKAIREIRDKEEELEFPPVISDGDKWGVSLEYLSQRTDFDYEVFENPNRIVILGNWRDLTTAKTADQVRVRSSASNRDDIVEEVDAGSTLVVLSSDEQWTKVCTGDGYCGYVKNNQLESVAIYANTHESREPEYTHQKRGQISLGFHQITTEEGNNDLETRLEGVSGLNVLSPTWFYLTDTRGNIGSRASLAYVNKAHEMGYTVWGLVDNFTERVDTLEMLSSTSARLNFIKQLVAYAKEYGLDGINLDFESISPEMEPHYMELIRELSIYCRKNTLVFSIDDPVPQFSGHIDRREQGTVADYIVVMGYDEHYSGSSVAGSNASLGFVKKAIEDTLAYVPASRVINAMPFYTRLWIEDYNSHELTCQTIGMEKAENFVVERGITTYWDASAGQNIAELDTDEAYYSMWMEDKDSLTEKLKLIGDYHLAGGAFWRLGFEQKEIWTLIDEYL